MNGTRILAAAAGAATFALGGLVAHASALAITRIALLGAALGSLIESDLAERRIPNRVVLPAAGGCAVLSAVGGTAPVSFAGGLALVIVLLALSLFRAQALGMGDVKLALLLVLGLDGRGALALLVAFALAAGFGLLLVARFGRAAFQRPLPLAPFFAAGALIAALT